MAAGIIVLVAAGNGRNTGISFRVGPREGGGVQHSSTPREMQQLHHPCLLLMLVNVEAQALALNP